VQELDRTGDATGFHCSTHGDFKVADAVFAEAKAKHYSREQWEAALEKAEERTEPATIVLILAVGETLAAGEFRSPPTPRPYALEPFTYGARLPDL
jgi:hypothetical protein